MNRTVLTLILNAVGTVGTADPERAMPLFEESLTLREARQVQEFLAWVHATGRMFGRGNIGAVWNEWKKSVTEARGTAPRPKGP